MRHGRHGDAWFRRFADYRKREDTKQPGKTGCSCRSGAERCHGCSARSGPSPTDHNVVLGRLGQPPVPPLPDHSVGRSIWPVRAHGRSCRSLRFCVPDDRDPLHHRVLTVQALLGPFGASRWHGESGTVDLSDQPIRLPHFAPRTRQATFSIAWFEPSCWALDRRSLQLAAVRRRRSSQCNRAD
jgi:hypothetical protein